MSPAVTKPAHARSSVEKGTRRLEGIISAASRTKRTTTKKASRFVFSAQKKRVRGLIEVAMYRFGGGFVGEG